MGNLILLPATGLLNLDCVIPAEDVITLVASTIRPQVNCPSCGHSSERVHSRYTRTVADLPWQGVAVRLKLKTRRFFCDRHECERHVFTEPLPQVVDRYARRTKRSAEALCLIASFLGGEAGARLARNLGMTISADTLLRTVQHRVPPPPPTPRVLGVDDWAYRKGHRYGTILVDLERRRPVDLLADREASTLAAWLKAHPGVEVISRDRASAYSEGNLDLAPSSLELSRLEIPLINSMKREEKLNQALQPVRRDYDLILIDCPPSLGIFTTNALFAADYVLIPVEAANYAVAGLTAIIDVINGVRRNGQDVAILGIFNTRVSGTNAAREAQENTQRLFSTYYIDIPIQVATASENAVREGRPLVIGEPKHKLSQAYRAIAKEILTRIKLEPAEAKTHLTLESAAGA